MSRVHAPGCEACLSALSACGSVYIDYTGQQHLTVETRLAVDLTQLAMQWYREDALEQAKWTERGELGAYKRLMGGGIPSQGCFICTAHKIAPGVIGACVYHVYVPELDDR